MTATLTCRLRWLIDTRRPATHSKGMKYMLTAVLAATRAPQLAMPEVDPQSLVDLPPARAVLTRYSRLTRVEFNLGAS